MRSNVTLTICYVITISAIKASFDVKSVIMPIDVMLTIVCVKMPSKVMLPICSVITISVIKISDVKMSVIMASSVMPTICRVS
jgi:hypothetical protein